MSPINATKITPNLIVSNVERSVAFYTEVLGFARGITVPEQTPFVFASVHELTDTLSLSAFASGVAISAWSWTGD